MSFNLQDFFNNPYREGYVRWPEGGVMYYIPEDKAKELMSEMLEGINKYPVIGDS